MSEQPCERLLAALMAITHDVNWIHSFEDDIGELIVLAITASTVGICKDACDSRSIEKVSEYSE